MKSLIAFCCLSSLTASMADPFTMSTDLDGDGTVDKIQIETNVIAVTGGKMTGRFPLPEGVLATSEASIRFVDLNGDGLADLLFADATNQAIYLWTKKARLDLGWMPGWSQKVRVGAKTNDPLDLPPLAGTSVTLKDGRLVIRPEHGEEISFDSKALIAVRMPAPLAPEAALATLRLPAGFQAELVAHEPEITDPVAFDWSADGRLWVVQMNDYPTGMDGQGKAGGCVKILTDSDGDGRFEKMTVFAEDLPFPTGIMPWGKGALIAAAPDIIYAEDQDGDGRADVKEVLFTGFEPGNQQHRFNGFEWGLDGWVYVANGDSGGNVKSIKTGKSVAINGRDVRFRPATGELETVSGMTQYGLRRDDWGNWFGNNNPAWLWHVTLPERYLKRNPKLAVKRVKQPLANYEKSNAVFPVSKPIDRPNQPWSLNHVTSACAPTPYRDSLFGTEFTESVFIGEPVHNTVHREVLEREGSGFRSQRAPSEKASEFLASTDNWFRPVFLRTGPDGALWVADFYRFVLEHPEWISPEMQARMDVRAGSDKGRIYRITPTSTARRKVPDLSVMTTTELVSALDSTNGWQRDMAQRMLLERRDAVVTGKLSSLLSPTHAPQVRIQALATLGGLSAVTEEILFSALADPHPWVRCEALRQSEAAARETLFPVIASLAKDADPAVRLQAAFTLGFWPQDRVEPVLAELAVTADETLRIAIMSSLQPESALCKALQQKESVPMAAVLPTLKPSSPDRAKVIATFANVDELNGDATTGKTIFTSICATCHRLHGNGQAVGPDLDMVGTKPTDWLLAATLDPAQSVEARYRGWLVTTKNGASQAGIISAETANNLVLRLPGGQEQAILRADIKAMEVLTGSLMPTGFESALTPQQMADLFQWLRKGK